MQYDFQRYLTAKRTVDDRALNRRVWDAMAQYLRRCQRSEDCSILEVGAGTGTMVQRMVEWGALWKGEYYAVDAAPENTAAAGQVFPQWAKTRGLDIAGSGPGERFIFTSNAMDLSLVLETVDVNDLIEREAGKQAWGMLVAHAFLDLFDIGELLPRLARLIRPNGLLYLTINFDGETIFEPMWDAQLEAQVIGLYHRTMDERVTDGHPSGDSRAGRHLFQVLAQNQLEILDAGSSDWIVYPHHGSYPGDEAYFLHHILHFFEESVGSRAEIEKERFTEWAQRRHAQIERSELVYMAHQIDFLVRKPF